MSDVTDNAENQSEHVFRLIYNSHSLIAQEDGTSSLATYSPPLDVTTSAWE